MDEVLRFPGRKTFFVFLALLALLHPQFAKADAIDFLGDVAQPIVGPAKEKLKSMAVYVWLQPYAGYAWGTSSQSRVKASGAVTSLNGLKTEGFLFGGRGGLLLMQTFKLGVDYSVQTITRDTLVENPVGTYKRGGGNGQQTLLGATIGFDLPYTPLAGQYTKYFQASLGNDAANKGNGWGAGVSFVLKSPFIVSLEKRVIDYSTSDITGKKATGKVDQYYITLSFMLL